MDRLLILCLILAMLFVPPSWQRLSLLESVQLPTPQAKEVDEAHQNADDDATFDLDGIGQNADDDDAAFDVDEDDAIFDVDEVRQNADDAAVGVDEIRQNADGYATFDFDEDDAIFDVRQNVDDDANLDIEKVHQNRDSEEVIRDIDDVKQAATGICRDGWLQFRNKACFYGLDAIRAPFYNGMAACAQVQANFSSIHSMDELRFVLAHFDLRRFWLGIFFGSSHFEDGTPLGQDLFEQFGPLMPWAPPELAKGFICRAKPEKRRKKWRKKNRG